MFRKLYKKISALASNPRPPGSIKLKGYSDHWRIRVGNYRVVYILYDAAKEIHITRVAHRKEAYD